MKSYNKNDLCNFCGSDYYRLYNDSANINFNTNCHKEMEGHYIDKNDILYKKCYLPCKKCDTKGNVTNHNCIECSKDYQYELEF